MDVDTALIRRLEALTGLACDDREREGLRGDLHGLLDYLNRLEDYVTGDDTDPLGSNPLVQRRADEPRRSITTVDAVADAPAVTDGCFVCPPIHDGD